MVREILILGTGDSVKVDDEHYAFALGVSPFYIDNHGYAISWVNKKRWRFHRLLFKHVHGYLPKEIDHKNRNPLDDRIENLRECTHAQNIANSKTQRGSSKYRGVCWNKQKCRWQANITVNYKLKYLGLFDSEFRAALVYDDAAFEAFGEFASLNFPERYQ